MSTEGMKRTYKVVMEVIKTHEFEVEDVNSPEEAIEIAEQYIADGEEGSISDTEIFETDAYPLDEEDEA